MLVASAANDGHGEDIGPHALARNREPEVQGLKRLPNGLVLAKRNQGRD
jgi:hypothetical protein